MKNIDCLGDNCPVPVMKLQKALNAAKPGDSFMLVTDHSCVPRSIEQFAKAKGLGFVADEVMTGVWELHLSLPAADEHK